MQPRAIQLVQPVGPVGLVGLVGAGQPVAAVGPAGTDRPPPIPPIHESISSASSACARSGLAAAGLPVAVICLLQQCQNSAETRQTTHTSVLHAVGLACGRLGACAGQKSRKSHVFAENLGFSPKISLKIWDFLMGNRCSEQCVRTPNDTERSQKAFISPLPTPFPAFPAQIWLRSSACPRPAGRPEPPHPPPPLLGII